MPEFRDLRRQRFGMDPNAVYSRHREDAFASQLTSSEYSTFVAMPFGNRFSYRSDDIYKNVLQAAASRANGLIDLDPAACGTRRFAVPKRIDDQAQTARSIGDEIIQAVLAAHVVLADLTFANDGVMLEVGAALALKPTKQIVLLTQGRASELHFDIKGNVVIEYSATGGVDKIASAMVAAAHEFERHRERYLTQLKQELSCDAILAMNWLGRGRTGKLHPGGEPVGLHEETGFMAFLQPPEPNNEPTPAQEIECRIRFQLCLRELLGRRLVWNHYSQRSPKPGQDSWSYRGTRLGWMFIEHLWDDLKCPEGELTASP